MICCKNSSVFFQNIKGIRFNFDEIVNFIITNPPQSCILCYLYLKELHNPYNGNTCEILQPMKNQYSYKFVLNTYLIFTYVPSLAVHFCHMCQIIPPNATHSRISPCALSHIWPAKHIFNLIWFIRPYMPYLTHWEHNKTVFQYES